MDSDPSKAEWATDANLRPWKDPPLPLVALIGCSDVHNSIISNIVKPSTQPQVMRILSLKDGHVFPRKKPRRVYEGYEPEGILKSNWIEKRKHIIPALCLRLVEWHESKSYEEQEQVLSLVVSKFRSDNFGRDLKLMVVVVLKNEAPVNLPILSSPTLGPIAPPPTFTAGPLIPGTPVGVTSLIPTPTTSHSSGLNLQAQTLLQERLTRSGKRFGLEAKGIFLFSTDSGAIKANVKKLQDIMMEMCTVKYRNDAKRSKNLKHHATQQKLYTRHHWKAAYYYETCREIASALKYYRSSYGYLKQLYFEKNSLCCIEYRTVGYLLNYKICQILLSLGRTPEALDQFNGHLSFFRGCEGPARLSFLYYAWISRQYFSFGGLLDHSPSTVVVRSKQFNPGFYYQTAAIWASKRKNLSVVALTSYPKETAPFAFIPPIYVGYPSRRRLLGDEKTKEKETEEKYDQYNEDDLLKASLHEENAVDLSQQIIAILGLAYDMYKKEESQKMKFHLVTLMAHEYYNSKQYIVAKRFYDSIVSEYREEGWWSISTSLVSQSLDCAKKILAGQSVTPKAPEINDSKLTHPVLYRHILSYTFDLLASRSALPHQAKKTLLEEAFALVQFLSNKIISLPTLLHAEDGSKELQQWHTILSNHYNITSTNGLVSCSSHFRSNTVPVHVKQNFTFILKIKTNFPIPIRFSKIAVFFTHPPLPNDPSSTSSASATSSYNFSIFPSPDSDTPSSSSDPNDLEYLAGFPQPLTLDSESKIYAKTIFLSSQSIIYRISFHAKQRQNISCSHILFYLDGTFNINNNNNPTTTSTTPSSGSSGSSKGSTPLLLVPLSDSSSSTTPSTSKNNSSNSTSRIGYRNTLILKTINSNLEAFEPNLIPPQDDPNALLFAPPETSKPPKKPSSQSSSSNSSAGGNTPQTTSTSSTPAATSSLELIDSKTTSGNLTGNVTAGPSSTSYLTDYYITAPLTIVSEKPRAYFLVEHAQPSLKEEYHNLLLIIYSDSDEIHNGLIYFNSLNKGQQNLEVSKVISNQDDEGIPRDESSEFDDETSTKDPLLDSTLPSESLNTSNHPITSSTSFTSSSLISTSSSSSTSSSTTSSTTSSPTKSSVIPTSPTQPSQTPQVRFYRLKDLTSIPDKQEPDQSDAEFLQAIQTGAQLSELTKNIESEENKNENNISTTDRFITAGPRTLTQITEPIPIPKMTSYSKHYIPIYVRTQTLHDQVVTATITYQNTEGVSLTYAGSFLVPVVLPFRPHFRLFSQHTETASSLGWEEKKDSSGRVVSRPETQHQRELLLNKPFIVHTELENICGHPLRLRSLRFITNTTHFRSNDDSEVGKEHDGETDEVDELAELISPLSPKVEGDDSIVILRPGERHTWLYHCQPTKLGQARPAVMHISWCRDLVSHYSEKSLTLKSPTRPRLTTIPLSPSSITPTSSSPRPSEGPGQDFNTDAKDEKEISVKSIGSDDAKDVKSEGEADGKKTPTVRFMRSRAKTMFRLKAGALFDPSVLRSNNYSNEDFEDGLEGEGGDEKIETQGENSFEGEDNASGEDGVETSIDPTQDKEFKISAIQSLDDDEFDTNLEGEDIDPIDGATSANSEKDKIRQNQKALFTNYQINLPLFNIGQPPLQVAVSHPPVCRMGETFQLSITMMNDSNNLQDIQITVPDLSGSILQSKMCISGITNSIIRLLPHSKESLYYRLIPLLPGYLSLPKIRLKSVSYDKLLMDPLDWGQVFVFSNDVNLSTS